jgi:aspartate/methionine/tyrosine aminotransferase
MELERGDHAYGPIGGTDALRQAVADHYNRLFRRGHREKYSASNVAIASGGRLALSRLLAALNDVRIGYQTPDYCGLTAALQRGRVAVSRRAGAQGELFPGGTST